MLFNEGRNTSKLPLTMGGFGPPSNAWLLGPTAPHMPMGRPLTTPKLPLVVLGSGPPSNMVTVAHPTPHAKRHLDRCSCFAIIHRRDQQSHRQTMNMASNRSHLYATPNNDRGHPRSSAMSPCDRAHTTSYSSLTENMHLSYTIFVIQRVICRNSATLPYPFCI